MKVCNTDARRIRSLAILASEERREALEPLYTHLCAHCGQLLGVDTSSEIFRAPPYQCRGQVCDIEDQPPFLLLWHPRTFAEKTTRCF